MDPRELQRSYYTQSADEYEDAHCGEDSSHDAALDVIANLIEPLGITSLLDVGTGTGRALKHLAAHPAEMTLRGIDPVPALLARAEASGVPADILDYGSGDDLPYAGNSFDAVCELGVLHHVAKPASVVSEMMRVARRAIFLSDNNRFGQGSIGGAIVKLALFRAGLWPTFETIRTRGKGYMFSRGDGVFYSYSVYDSYDQLARWADDLVLVGLGQARRRCWLTPLLTHQNVLLCALRRERSPSAS